MPRKRFISPEFFQHADLYDAELATAMPLRLAFAGLWTVCDRRGLFWWRPRELKLAVLPYDLVDFEAVLSALEDYGFVVRYEVDGKLVGHVPSFSRWQTFHRNEQPSDIPEPSKGRREPSKGRRGPSPSIAVTVAVATTATAAVAAAREGPRDPLRDSLRDSLLTADVMPTDVADGEAVVREAESTHRTLLTAAVNQGITAQFGEQPIPCRWDQPGTFQTAQLLESAGVPLAFARQALYQLAKTRTPADGRAPRSMAYYAAAVVDAWRAEEAHRLAAIHPVPTGGMAGGVSAHVLSWDAMIAREEEAARVA